MRIAEAFKTQFNTEFRLFAAPGRINLIGEHTDYNQGFVFPAAIDLEMQLAVSPSDGSEFTILALDQNEICSFGPAHETERLPQWARYPFGVIMEMAREGRQIGGFSAVLAGNIPAGAGLSSSAALESVFAMALNELFSLGFTKKELALIGQRAEHNYAGVNCGIMDQYASLFGKAHHAIQLDCRSLEHKEIPMTMNGHGLLLLDSRVKHSLAASAYNQRRNECEEGLKWLQRHKPEATSLRDFSAAEIRVHLEQMPGTLYRRCLYVAQENERVLQFSSLLQQAEPGRGGRLLFASHQGLSQLYEVSCPELDLLVDIAKQTEGVAGARMMGGGFGGCTLNLIKTDKMEHLERKAKTRIAEGFGHEPAAYQVKISQGAREQKLL